MWCRAFKMKNEGVSTHPLAGPSASDAPHWPLRTASATGCNANGAEPLSGASGPREGGLLALYACGCRVPPSPTRKRTAYALGIPSPVPDAHADPPAPERAGGGGSERAPESGRPIPPTAGSAAQSDGLAQPPDPPPQNFGSGPSD